MYNQEIEKIKSTYKGYGINVYVEGMDDKAIAIVKAKEKNGRTDRLGYVHNYTVAEKQVDLLSNRILEGIITQENIAKKLQTEGVKTVVIPRAKPNKTLLLSRLILGETYGTKN